MLRVFNLYFLTRFFQIAEEGKGKLKEIQIFPFNCNLRNNAEFCRIFANKSWLCLEGGTLEWGMGAFSKMTSFYINERGSI